MARVANSISKATYLADYLAEAPLCDILKERGLILPELLVDGTSYPDAVYLRSGAYHATYMLKQGRLYISYGGPLNSPGSENHLEELDPIHPDLVMRMCDLLAKWWIRLRNKHLSKNSYVPAKTFAKFASIGIGKSSLVNKIVADAAAESLMESGSIKFKPVETLLMFGSANLAAKEFLALDSPAPGTLARAIDDLLAGKVVEGFSSLPTKDQWRVSRLANVMAKAQEHDIALKQARSKNAKYRKEIKKLMGLDLDTESLGLNLDGDQDHS